MEYNTTPPNSEFIRDNYGQFVMLNDHNEIMCYSRNGKPIYYIDDPPASPVKNKLSNPNEIHIEDEYIPKYINVIDISPQTSYSIDGILYGIVSAFVILVMFMSIYILFFE